MARAGGVENQKAWSGRISMGWGKSAIVLYVVPKLLKVAVGVTIIIRTGCIVQSSGISGVSVEFGKQGERYSRSLNVLGWRFPTQNKALLAQLVVGQKWNVRVNLFLVIALADSSEFLGSGRPQAGRFNMEDD